MCVAAGYGLACGSVRSDVMEWLETMEHCVTEMFESEIHDLG